MVKPFHERRKHKRYEYPFAMFFYVKGKRGVTYEMSQVNNISLGGINFSSNCKCPKGARVCMELKTPFTPDIIQIEGILHECMEVVDGKLYRMRIEFKDPSQVTME